MTRIETIRAHQQASNALWRELEQQGYHSGGCDQRFSETAIVKGDYPRGTIVGYVNLQTLEIRWLHK